MIRALLEYYRYLLDTGLIKEQFGWAEIAVPLTLDIDANGKVLSIKSNVYVEKNEKGKERQVIPRMLLPYHPVRSNNIQANMFADRAEYILGIGEKGAEKFLAAKELHEKALKLAKSPVANAILLFFSSWDAEHAQDTLTEAQKEMLAANLTGNILITVDGVDPCTDDNCAAAYNAYVQKVGISGSTVYGIDCITGEYGMICRVHPKIKGIRAAATGAPLCTINNSSSIHATGREQGYGTPMTEMNVYRYSTALEYLTHSQQHNYYDKYSGVNILCWSTDCSEAQQAAMLYALTGTSGKDESGNEATAYLNRIFAGVDNPPEGFEPDATMHIVGLDSRDGYIIRQVFCLEGRFQDLMGNIRQHYWDTRICGKGGVPFWKIYEAICRKKKDGTVIDDRSRITADIIYNLLNGGKYPEQILDLMLVQVQIKAQANEDYLLTVPQAGFMRAYLRKNKKEDISEMLDTENRDIGYLCGRIFASAVNIERASKSGEQTQRTMAQNLGEAMRHPADYFPLMTAALNRAYLCKLYSKTKTAALAAILEKEFGELVDMIPTEGYPRRLTRAQQAQFCTGYYQQRNKYIQDAMERKAMRENSKNEEDAA